MTEITQIPTAGGPSDALLRFYTRREGKILSPSATVYKWHLRTDVAAVPGCPSYVTQLVPSIAYTAIPRSDPDALQIWENNEAITASL